MRRPPETALLPDGFVDLREAINIAGRIEFGDDWTGEEVDAEWDWLHRDNLEGSARRERDGLLKGLAELGDSLEGIDEQEALEMCKARLLKEDTERNRPRQRREDVATKLRPLLHGRFITAKALLPSGRLIELGEFIWAGEIAPGIFETGTVCVENGAVLAPRLGGAQSSEIAYVLLDRKELERAGKGEDPRKTRQSLKPALDQCIEWLTSLMRKTPEKKPVPKSRLKTEALVKFPGLSGRGFDFAWKTAAHHAKATAWTKPGRLPGN